LILAGKESLTKYHLQKLVSSKEMVFDWVVLRSSYASSWVYWQVWKIIIALNPFPLVSADAST
jgi:hypothetical protein